jgi:hypothetical protein
MVERACVPSIAHGKAAELRMVGIGGSDSYADGDAGNFPPHSVTLCTKQNTFHLIRGFRVGAQDGDSRGSRLLQAFQDFVSFSNDFHDS